MKKTDIYICKFAVALIAAATAFVSGCKKNGASAPADSERPAPAVQVAKPLHKSVEFWDDYTARLEALAYVELRARVGGYLQTVAFKEGEFVREGDLLFVIDPRPYEAALASAKAQVKEVEARLTLAKSNTDRARELFAAKAISKETFETRTSELLSAEAALLDARARLRDAELNLEFTHIRAPISGKVGEAMVDAGNLVSANSTLLTTIVKCDVIQAYFEISERDNIRYKNTGLFKQIDSVKKTGPKTKIVLLDGKTTRDGKLTYFDNKIGTETSSLTMRADFDNSDYLLSPGMFAKISVLAEKAHPVVLVPEDIIGTDLVNRYVIVVDKNNVAQYRPVKVGRLLGKYRVIDEGLSPDDRIVAVGLQRAAPGTKVAPTEIKFEEVK